MASILLIDDDEIFRETIAADLIAHGFTVRQAADGAEGLNLFRAAPADLVITDMVMPHGGLSAIRVLREQYPEVKVIAMTGGPGRRLGYARDLGACCTLTKPFTSPQLVDAVAVALSPPPDSPILST
jgi:CheY-like chemotaxis protein